MRENASGRIERMGNNGKSFLLQEFEGKWFGAFNATQLSGANTGDEVSFTYTSVEKNGRTFHNINGNLAIVSSSGGTTPPTASGVVAKVAKVGEPILSRDRLILRQNALTNAVNFMSLQSKDGGVPEISDVLKTAAEFEAYTSGDIEKKASKDTKEAPSDEAWKAAADAFDDVKELKKAS